MTVEVFNALCKDCKECSYESDCMLSEHKDLQKLVVCKVDLENCHKIGRGYTEEEFDAENFEVNYVSSS